MMHMSFTREHQHELRLVTMMVDTDRSDDRYRLRRHPNIVSIAPAGSSIVVDAGIAACLFVWLLGSNVKTNHTY
jgi:hypothetical protein